MVVTITGSKAVLDYSQHIEALGRVLNDLGWSPTKILIGSDEVGADRLAFRYAEKEGIPTSIVHRPPASAVKDPPMHQNQEFVEKSTHILVITEQPTTHLRRLLELASKVGRSHHWRRWSYPDGIQEYVRRVESKASPRDGELLVQAIESTFGMPFEVVIDGPIGTFETRWPKHSHQPIEIRMNFADARRLRGAATAAVRDYRNLVPQGIPSAQSVTEFLRKSLR